MEGDSRSVSRQWVTADAYLVPSAAGADVTLYDGENNTGDLIVTLKSAAVTGHKFKPPVPIYCRKGLYVDIGSNVTGVLVMWRGL